MVQQWEVRGRATSIRQKDDTLIVRYHKTDVVKVTPNSIILDTGGWKTATTKTRMNQASNNFDLGYSVFQKDYKWYVKQGNKVKEFKGDKIVLPRKPRVQSFKSQKQPQPRGLKYV